MTDDKQVAAMRKAFEAFVLTKPGANARTLYRVDFVGSTRIGEYASSSVEFGWLSWQAATLAERERCAKVCEKISDLNCGNIEIDACSDTIRAGEALEGGT